MSTWMKSFTFKNPSNNKDSRYHNWKWSMNGMICLTTLYSICHLLLVTTEQRGIKFAIHQELCNGKTFCCWSVYFSPFLYPMLHWRECSAAWEESRPPRELHSPRELFRISWGSKRKDHQWRPMTPQLLSWSGIGQKGYSQTKSQEKSTSQDQQNVKLYRMILLMISVQWKSEGMYCNSFTIQAEFVKR